MSLSSAIVYRKEGRINDTVGGALFKAKIQSIYKGENAITATCIDIRGVQQHKGGENKVVVRN